jgi:SH3-like domain-containing protein
MPRLLIACLAACTLATAASAGPDRKPPYWASISATEARMRTGPSLNYPATWLYKRRDLPIRVVGTQPSWRKVQDPDGATGWILVSLLSDTRTAIIPRGAPRLLRRSPADNAAAVYRVQPGVVGRVSKCAGGWCRMDVKGRSGYIRTGEIWGVDPQEELE